MLFTPASTSFTGGPGLTSDLPSGGLRHSRFLHSVWAAGTGWRYPLL